jgi:hypothetical protein
MSDTRDTEEDSHLLALLRLAERQQVHSVDAQSLPPQSTEDRWISTLGLPPTVSTQLKQTLRNAPKHIKDQL